VSLCNKALKAAKAMKPNRLVEQLIDALKICCVNADVAAARAPPAKRRKKNKGSAAAAASVDNGGGDGCKWVGAISEMPKHEAECDMAKTECENVGCVVSVRRDDMQAHRDVCPERRVRCLPGCKRIMHVRELAEHKSSACPARMIVCPNEGCAVSVGYTFLANHRAGCESELLKCGFGGDKCDGVYKRGDGRAAHDKAAMQSHLFVAMAVINEQSREIEAIKSAATRQTRTIDTMKAAALKTKTEMKAATTATTKLTKTITTLQASVSTHSDWIDELIDEMAETKTAIEEVKKEAVKTKTAVKEVKTNAEKTKSKVEEITETLFLKGAGVAGMYTSYDVLSFTSASRWFLGNKLTARVAVSGNGNTYMWLKSEEGMSKIYEEISITWKGMQVAHHTNVCIGYAGGWEVAIWNISTIYQEAIKCGDRLNVIIKR
jgi:hypothetical protein